MANCLRNQSTAKMLLFPNVVNETWWRLVSLNYLNCQGGLFCISFSLLIIWHSSVSVIVCSKTRGVNYDLKMVSYLVLSTCLVKVTLSYYHSITLVLVSRFSLAWYKRTCDCFLNPSERGWLFTNCINLRQLWYFDWENFLIAFSLLAQCKITCSTLWREGIYFGILKIVRGWELGLIII